MNTNSQPIEVGRNRELVYVVIAGKYTRTVPAWEIGKLRRDLRARRDIPAASRLHVYHALERIEAEYESEIGLLQDSDRSDRLGSLLFWWLAIAAAAVIVFSVLIW